MREYLKKWFIRFLVKDVFHTISKEDILKIKDGVWTWKGKEMTEEDVQRVKVQAAAFQQSFLWKVLSSELQWLAAKTLLERGSSETDVRVAQIQGYLTQVVDRKLEDLTK